MHEYPVLYTAIIENIDTFITGDKDFLDVEVEMPTANFIVREYKL